MPDSNNGWNEYSRLVLKELDRLDKKVAEIDKLRTAMAVMKVKIALIGAGIGALPGVAALILALVRGLG